MKKIALGLLLLTMACNAELPGSFETRAKSSSDGNAAQYSKVKDAPEEGQAGGVVAGPPVAVPNRMIIRIATVSAIVSDPGDALQKITIAAERRGGYIAESRQWREGEQNRAQATIRVPAQYLNAVLQEIRASAVRIDDESVSGQDVSQEYTDLAAQLVNMERTERELRELLTTVRQRTGRAADILEIYNEITRIRGMIEQTKGRIKYLDAMTTMSTINLHLIPDVVAKPVVEPGWQPVAVIKNASRALINSLQGLADVVIWFGIYLLPMVALFILFALVMRLVWLRLRPHMR